MVYRMLRVSIFQGIDGVSYGKGIYKNRSGEVFHSYLHHMIL